MRELEGNKVKTVALLEDLNVNKRNFLTLYQYLENTETEFHVLLDQGSELFKTAQCFGKYPKQHVRLQPYINGYRYMGCDDLFLLKKYNINLWRLCRSELMCYLLSKEEWHENFMLKYSREEFDYVYNNYHDDLISNIGAAAYWLDEWYLKKDVLQKYSCVFMFSGSLIYARSLMEFVRRSATKCYVLESTFSGNQFYLDERYTPIANNPSIVPLPEAFPGSIDREIIKAKNKSLNIKNKNVTQPQSRGLLTFGNNEPTVLLVAQVPNDFSLIEPGFPFSSSISAYKKLIYELITKTRMNIIIKSHPWENHKVHLRNALTYKMLTSFLKSLSEEQQSRVLLVEDFNIYDLFDCSQYFVTFTSQSGIEALVRGFRPFVLGNSFYASDEYCCRADSVESLVDKILSERPTLTLEEYKKFEFFLIRYFQLTTISTTPEGLDQIAHKMTPYVITKQTSPEREELLARKPINARHIAESSKINYFTKETLKTEDRIKISVNCPTTLDSFASEVISLTMVVTNNSNIVLAPYVEEPRYKVSLSYHLVDTENVMIEWNGLRTPLAFEVFDKHQQEFSVKLPGNDGVYKIRPALVISEVCWIESGEEIVVNCKKKDQ